MPDKIVKFKKKTNNKQTPKKPEFKIVITPEILNEALSDMDLSYVRRFHVNNIQQDGSSYHLIQTTSDLQKELKYYNNYLAVVTRNYRDIHFDFRRSGTIDVKETDFKKFLSEDRIKEIKTLNNTLYLDKSETELYLTDVVKLKE